MSKKGEPMMPVLEPSDIHVGDVVMVRMYIHRYWPRLDTVAGRDPGPSQMDTSSPSSSKTSPSTPTKSGRSQDSRTARPWVADFYLKSIFLLHCAGDDAKEEENREYDFTRLYDEVFEETDQLDDGSDSVGDNGSDGEFWEV